jgi:hypothetical protein
MEKQSSKVESIDEELGNDAENDAEYEKFVGIIGKVLGNEESKKSFDSEITNVTNIHD